MEFTPIQWVGRGKDRMMQIVARFMALLLAIIAVPAWAETVATAMSPGKRLTVTLELDNDGRPSYTVSRGGKPVIATSRLGFILADAPKLDRNFKLPNRTALPPAGPPDRGNRAARRGPARQRQHN